MLRSTSIRALQGFLQAHYAGPVAILCQEDDGAVHPPYAVVRVGSAEDIGMGQADIWDLNVLVAVFHDAEQTTIETAESAAAAVFAALADPDEIIAYLAAQGVVVSAWLPLTSEAGLVETRWNHIGGFRLIAAPAA